MPIEDRFVTAVLMVMMLAVVQWFRRASWRARMWAGLLWAAVMVIILAVVQW
jgi:hypothetical protein